VVLVHQTSASYVITGLMTMMYNQCPLWALLISFSSCRFHVNPLPMISRTCLTLDDRLFYQRVRVLKSLFLVKGTRVVLSRLTNRPLFSHHFWTFLKAPCINSYTVLQNFPLIRTAMSSAHPTVKLPSSPSSFRSPSTTRLHRRGDGTPP
jgi:hypothetical protein